MNRRRRAWMTPMRVAIAFAVVTTILAMIASSLNAITDGRPFEVTLHRFAMIAMLISYMMLILAIILFKKKPLPTLRITDGPLPELEMADGPDILSLAPCDRSQVVIFDASDLDGIRKTVGHISSHAKYAMRVAVARSLTLPESFLQGLECFPNLLILDIQGATLPERFWDSLEDLPSIENVLVHGCVTADQVRKLSISLPEVRFWLEPRKLAIISQQAMNQLGVSEVQKSHEGSERDSAQPTLQ